MVDYDSIIPPGRVGKITQQIKINKFKSGPFTKAIKVMSNAKNTEVLRLSISGKILSVINLSKRFLRLKPNKDGKVKNNLMLSTEKQDLKILRMSFKENKKNSPSWQSESVLFIKYAMTMTDSADADGYYTYSLDFSFDIAPTKTVSGYFFLDTNHPKKKTIKIRGMILPIKKEEK